MLLPLCFFHLMTTTIIKSADKPMGRIMSHNNKPEKRKVHLEAVNIHFPVVTTSCQRSQSVGLCERALTKCPPKAQSPPDIQTLNFKITTVTECLHPSVSRIFRHLLLILTL